MAVSIPCRLIALTGFMGSGKTTVGRLLAERLGWRFVDLDGRIVERAQASIVSIFRNHGEAAFREIEAEILDRALGEATEGERRIVIALGGGTLTRPENMARLRQAGAALVWLDCPIDDLIERCTGIADRPLFRDAASFRALYEERRPIYCQADFRVESAAEPNQVVERILALLGPALVDA